MKYIISQSQYKKLWEHIEPERVSNLSESIILEQYNSDRLYPKEYVIRVLKTAPRELKHLRKNLLDIPCVNGNGEETVCTKIPENLYVYMTGRY